MIRRLALMSGLALLLAGCAAGPDYGYGYGYASHTYDSCGWGGPCDNAYGPYSYGYGPSLSLDLGVGGDRDRGDRERRGFVRDRSGNEARGGAGGERHDREAGRSSQRPQERGGDRGHDGGDHGHDHDR